MLSYWAATSNTRLQRARNAMFNDVSNKIGPRDHRTRSTQSWQHHVNYTRGSLGMRWAIHRNCWKRVQGWSIWVDQDAKLTMEGFTYASNIKLKYVNAISKGVFQKATRTSDKFPNVGCVRTFASITAWRMLF